MCIRDRIVPTTDTLLTEAFSAFDKDLHDKTGNKFNKIGSTVVATFLHGSTLYVANVGDSKAVASNGKVLTVVHDVKQEKERIDNATDAVLRDGQVGMQGNAYFCKLTRSLGDFILKQEKKDLFSTDVYKRQGVESYTSFM